MYVLFIVTLALALPRPDLTSPILTPSSLFLSVQRMSSTHSNDGHENWPHTLLLHTRFLDSTNESEKLDYKTCSSLLIGFCFPCILMGRTASILENEEAYYCCSCLKLGPKGLCCCGCSALLNGCIPVCTISPFFAIGVIYQRSRIMDQFNIHGGFFEAMKGCCCICSVYQQYNFANDFKWRKLQRVGASFDSNTTISHSPSFNKSIDK